MLVKRRELTLRQIESLKSDSSTFRTRVVAAEKILGELEQVRMPLRHTFPKDMYVREIFIPALTFVIGKIHKTEHINIITEGIVSVWDEERSGMLKAPYSFVSRAGIKKTLYTWTDVSWITVHANPTNEHDLAKLEEMLIASDYEALDSHLGIVP